MTTLYVKLPDYGRYKNTEIEWANQIPLHWEVKALKGGCRS